MGIDVHGLNFLRFSKKKKMFGNTLTIGRQGLHISNQTISKILNVKTNYSLDKIYRWEEVKFCEDLLIDHFGSIKVDSIDNSDYEKATFVYDMNLPIPEHLHEVYDTVIDGGTLEHIYNIPQALKNCSSFLKPGGQIIHCLPANNYCGHGFYQFSPELFFSLYSEENGYTETEVFIADLKINSKWFQVCNPHGVTRVNVSSSNPLYVMVRSVLEDKNFRHDRVQQSDYVNVWSKKSVLPKTFYHKISLRFQGFPLILTIFSIFYAIFRRPYLRLKGIQIGTKLNSNRKDLKVINVGSVT